MRLLLDQNLPRKLVTVLDAAGHDVFYTGDVGLALMADPYILDWCCRERRVLVTADKRLTKYLAATRATCPSVVVVRVCGY